ncbi:hypothetical protein DRF62_05190 [Chryseobacterium piscium]|uniref:Uncharacterized protein n=1 Tax=Chryseobacterium piscium TaxID=333702 RepID=A0A3D9BQL6_9FLAO|nr:hypothetical protein [Chryseobacterium piscium]REC55804.1 hypothetical protein DRF62_05190 [Chryseobacterium piscium]
MNSEIAFHIGDQYENWEFDLEINFDLQKTIANKELYLVYNWVSQQKKFLNYRPHSAKLIYYWDILNTVILNFLNNEQAFYNNLNQRLTKKFNNPIIVNKNEDLIYKFKDEEIEYWSILRNDSIIILYGYSKNLERFYNTLLC